MKIHHKINHDWKPPASPLRSDPVSPRFQAEVDLAVRHLQRRYERAQERLRQAEAKLAKAQSAASAHRLEVLEALVDLRRRELQDIQRMMTSSPASAEHRGRRSFRPVGFGGDPL